MTAANFSINDNAVHLWRAPLTISTEEEDSFFALLNEDEKKRANRFHFPQHKRRFVAARGLLRQLLSYYLSSPPADIVILNQVRGKPYVPDATLQFNVSHSEEMAVFALANAFSVGVDIEMIKDDFNHAVAERYFHPEEYAQVLSFPKDKQAAEFYRIWACKEAWVKAIGEGLHFPLADFSVLADKPADWVIQNFAANPDYQSAFAAQHEVGEVVHYEWVNGQPVII
jgi:4'-phosphopantetheinyl transferase